MQNTNEEKNLKKFENGERLPLVWERILCLILAALFGLWLAQNANQPLQKLLGFHPIFPFLPEDKGSVQLAILLMSLPVFFVLWLFRTWDTREHIKKTGQGAEAAMLSAEATRQSAETAKQSAEAARQSAETAKQNEKTARENVETAQKSLAANTLARCIDMLAYNNIKTRCLGLVQLADLKRKGHLVEEIDVATQQQLELIGGNLEGEDLSDMNLERVQLINANLSGKTNFSRSYMRRANMHNAIMQNAILKDADLQGAVLAEADVMNADFRGADLREAHLHTAKNLESAKLKGAKYNNSTRFPEWFDEFREKNAKKMGMIYTP